jgi:hypothetical protein
MGFSFDRLFAFPDILESNYGCPWVSGDNWLFRFPLFPTGLFPPGSKLYSSYSIFPLFNAIAIVNNYINNYMPTL